MKTIYDDIMTMQPKYQTFGENLFFTYATWQALYACVAMGEESIGRKFYMMRSMFYNKFKNGKQHISSLFKMNRMKVQCNDFCFYCYEPHSAQELTADHVFPRAKGGKDEMDNIIFVCKNCNSSKGKRDMIEWFLNYRNALPSPFVLGHYLRQIYTYAESHELMNKSWDEVCNSALPFNPRSILLLLNSKARLHYLNVAIKGRNDSEDVEV